MAVTGSGTKDDPYIVSTWSELLSTATSGTVYIETDGTDKIIDFQELGIAPYQNTITLNAASINLKGWILQNFISFADTAITIPTRGCTFSNIIFNNFFHYHFINRSSSTVYRCCFITTGSGSETILLDNCVFRGGCIYANCLGYLFYSPNYANILARSCTINISASTNTPFTMFLGLGLSSCNVSVDINAAEPSLVEGINVYPDHYCSFCKFTGGIRFNSCLVLDSTYNIYQEGVYYRISDGQPVSSSTYNTRRIEILPDVKYFLRSNSAIGTVYYNFFDEQDTHISGVSSNASLFYLNIPNNTQYLYVSTRTSDSNWRIRSEKLLEGVQTPENNIVGCGSKRSEYNIYNIHTENCYLSYAGYHPSVYNSDYALNSGNNNMIGVETTYIYDLDYLKDLDFAVQIPSSLSTFEWVTGGISSSSGSFTTKETALRTDYIEIPPRTYSLTLSMVDNSDAFSEYSWNSTQQQYISKGSYASLYRKGLSIFFYDSNYAFRGYVTFTGSSIKTVTVDFTSTEQRFRAAYFAVQINDDRYIPLSPSVPDHKISSSYSSLNVMNNVTLEYMILKSGYWNMNSDRLTNYIATQDSETPLTIKEMFPADGQPIGACSTNENLRSVLCPASVLHIGRFAFSNTALRTITINSSCIYSDTSFPVNCTVKFYIN